MVSLLIKLATLCLFLQFVACVSPSLGRDYFRDGAPISYDYDPDKLPPHLRDVFHHYWTHRPSLLQKYGAGTYIVVNRNLEVRAFNSWSDAVALEATSSPEEEPDALMFWLGHETEVQGIL